MSVKTYKIKQPYIQAIQYMGDNLKDVNKFVDGRAEKEHTHNDIAIKLEDNFHYIGANIGDYIVKIDDEFEIFDSDYMDYYYDEIN